MKLTKVIPIRRHFSFEEHLQFFILEKKAQGIELTNQSAGGEEVEEGVEG